MILHLPKFKYCQAIVARNRRVVISVREKFEIEHYHRYCKTNINASCLHLLLVCCHGVHTCCNGYVPFYSCLFIRVKLNVSQISNGTNEKARTKRRESVESLKMLIKMLMNMIDAYGYAYEDSRSLWRCLSINPQRS